MKRRRSSGSLPAWLWLLLLLATFTPFTSAARVDFQSCQERTTDPTVLHFTPYIVDAKFSETTEHALTFEVYGNVTGGTEIINTNNETNFITTLKTQINVLSYTPYDKSQAFCGLTTEPCPLRPVPSYINRSNPDRLHGFTFTNDMTSSYAFSTLTTRFTIKSPDSLVTIISCIETSITPYLGPSLTMLLIFIPLAILLMMGLATVLAAVYNPWNGTKDVFAWSSNFGRDADMLRLVTPGFADCLQYLQFIFLTGGLSLNYPGFYQPVVSKAAWSMLLFNISLVTDESRSRLVDNIYTQNATYGLESLSQLVGVGTGQDIWAGFMVVFAGITGVILVGGLLMAALRWGLKRVKVFESGDLRAKNLPFLGGLMIRVVFNYLYQPLFVFSAFQLLMAGRGPLSINVVAGIVLVALIIIGAIIVRRISTYKPRSPLYDDLPTLLLYGPLYNTYDESATLFCIVYLAIATLRSITIGFVQPSGIAQLVLLAICEIIMILTLNAFRPYSSKTSMNLYQTFFSIIRLICVLFLVTFVPSLEIGYVARGWIGYIILLLHGVVLIFGFFMNAVQTIVEVLARLAGAGDGTEGDALRGGLARVFGKRQLARRDNRRDTNVSQVVGHGELVAGIDGKGNFIGGNGRPNSLSGSSAMLMSNGLAMTPTTDTRLSTGIQEQRSPMGAFGHRHTSSTSTGFTPNTPQRASNYSYFENSAPSISLNAGVSGSSMGNRVTSQGFGVPMAVAAAEATPYYRTPRKSRPGSNSRTLSGGGPMNGADWYNISTGGPSSHNVQNYSRAGEGDINDGDRGLDSDDEYEYNQSHPGPIPQALTRDARLALDSASPDPRRTDYAVREGDFYYGVRGPALSTLPTRKLGTGPADPTGPVTVAKGWFARRFTKGKESSKGFEVVRSARAPPPVRQPIIDDDSQPGAMSREEQLVPEDTQPETYDGAMEIESPVEERSRGFGEAQNERNINDDDDSDDYSNSEHSSDDDDDDGVGKSRPQSQLSPLPPVLPALQLGNDIELAHRRSQRSDRSLKPNVPRKSSRRKATRTAGILPQPTSAIYSAVPQSSVPANMLYDPPLHPNNSHQSSLNSTQRLPFTSSREHIPVGAGERTSYAASSDDGSALAGAMTENVVSHDRPSSMGAVHRVNVGDAMSSADERYLGLGSTAELVEGRGGSAGSGSAVSGSALSGSALSGSAVSSGPVTLGQAVKYEVKRKAVPKH